MTDTVLYLTLVTKELRPTLLNTKTLKQISRRKQTITSLERKLIEGNLQY